MASAENLKLFGRTTIYTSATEITKDNILDILDDCNSVHETNVAQENYLYDYYRGNQDIQSRTKDFNDYVLNKITENHAKSIVDFKTAFLVGEPIKYSANDQNYADAVDMLNDFCRLEGKETIDYDLVEWMNICGTSYRLVLPKSYAVEEGESPFFVVTLDPRTAFVAYSSSIPHIPRLCCYTTTDDDDVTTYTVYARSDTDSGTSFKYFAIVDDEIVDEQDWTLNTLPIIEYPHGKARLGAFEPVISLLNAVNNLDSNRMDSVEQFVQSLLVLVNCKLPEGYNASNIKEMGLVELISNDQNKAEISQIASTLDQTNTQTLKEDMLEAIRSIVAMPTVSADSTGGDNGLAVLYRNGWEGAYESAMTDQKAIDSSEYMALKLILEICRDTNSLDVPLRVVDIDYTRQHYENLPAKSQVLIAMLNNDKIHPKVAYEACGMFYDPNKKYLLGMEWMKEQQGKAEEQMTEEQPEEEVIEETVDEEDSTETETVEV